MKTNELLVFQPIDSNILLVLITALILVIGYGLYRKMKLDEGER